MKYLPLLILVILFGSCSHYRYITKHKAEICATCPTEMTTETTQTDTTYYGEVPPDTITIYGFETQHDTVFIDNVQYKIIRTQGETKVIIKKRLVPITVTRYKDSSVRVVNRNIDRPYIPVWVWFAMCGIAVLSWVLRGYLAKLRKYLFR